VKNGLEGARPSNFWEGKDKGGRTEGGALPRVGVLVKSTQMREKGRHQGGT